MSRLISRLVSVGEWEALLGYSFVKICVVSWVNFVVDVFRIRSNNSLVYWKGVNGYIVSKVV